MSPLLRWVSVIGAIAGLTVGSIGLLRQSHAADDLQSARDRFRQTTTAALEVVRLRGTAATELVGEPLSDNVLREVHSILAEIGLPPKTAQRLERHADRPATAGSIDGRMVRRYTLHLNAIDPARLGVFLARWAELQPRWTPTSVRLAAQRPARNHIGPPPFDATIDLATVFLPSDTMSEALADEPP